MLNSLKVVMALFFFTLILGEISCYEILEGSLENKKVSLITPVLSTVLDSNVQFSWTSLESAKVYNLQIVYPSFSTAARIVVDTTLANTTYFVMLHSGKYEWRVQARNNSSNTNYVNSKFEVK